MLLNAVLCVWNEEDIIESTVRHLFAQGCSNVFIIDNASTDQTVKNALAAGARLAAVFSTKDFEEDQKVAHLNAVVKQVNAGSPEEHIWWLYADADEFPNFDCNSTILDVLKQLDPSVGAIHGYLFDHTPTHPPYHVQGYHPADFQPLGVKTGCGKIPLLRYAKGRRHLFSIGGAHDFISHGETVFTAKDLLQIHHFPYRNPEYTFKRSKILAETRNEWYKKFIRQEGMTIMSGYEYRYRKLNQAYDQCKNNALKTKDLIYNYANIVRWYDLHAEKPFACSDYEESVCKAVYYFFSRAYDIALCRFNDAFNLCASNDLRVWLTVKMAECLYTTDPGEANSLLSIIKTYDNTELKEYMRGDLAHVSGKADKKETSPDNLSGKIEPYASIFPAGIEEQYAELGKTIEKRVSETLKGDSGV